jgi:hypothetical protein
MKPSSSSCHLGENPDKAVFSWDTGNGSKTVWKQNISETDKEISEEIIERAAESFTRRGLEGPLEEISNPRLRESSRKR